MIRAGRLHSSSDVLFAAIDELVTLTGGDWEATVDELVNVSFDATEKPPRREKIDPGRLADARDRLHRAGREWAGAVLQVTAVKSLADQLGVPIAGLDSAVERLIENERVA